MLNHEIDFPEAFDELVKYVKQNNYTQGEVNHVGNDYSISFTPVEKFIIPMNKFNKLKQGEIVRWLDSFNLNGLIFGNNPKENIVSCEVKDNLVELFIETEEGIKSEFITSPLWLLCNERINNDWKQMQGNLHYKWKKTFATKQQQYIELKKNKDKDFYVIHDPKEAAMLTNGFTYFKGMKVKNVSILGFDIESTGLLHNDQSKVLLISNTYRKGDKVIRKLFAYDEYEDEAGMFNAWSEWVREVNPSVMLGHNIFMYDLPYMEFCSRKVGSTLKLGRDGSNITFAKKESKFRKDGSQFYDYKKCWIYGREIVDTMFLAIRFDFARKYENYRLKQIIKQEGLEVKDRVFYNADTIKDNYKNPEEWAKIKKYAEHDADDAIALWDLMVPAYFYLTPSIPKSFQSMLTSASGSQINAFLVRSYLQENHSIPKAGEPAPFEGAISIGNPGIYQNVFKIDVASLYPSIMLQYNVHDPEKDPKNNFIKMVSYFTKERLTNKKLGADTGQRYYKELSEAQKIVINSAYGFMGAEGLNFNSVHNAAFVTEKGREVLQQAIKWAEDLGYKIVNADTDSISFTNGEFISIEKRKELLDNINSLYPEKIKFADDGYYPAVLVIKAKNYVLQDEKGKIKTKGSALKASMKEFALKEFINKITGHLLKNDVNSVVNEYHTYVREILNLQDISRWTHRKTVTESVLNPERTNEEKILDAIEDADVQMGDKVHMYFTMDGSLKLQENWTRDHDPFKLIEKLWKTVIIFENVIDVKLFTKYHLKTKRKLLNELESLEQKTIATV